MAKFWWMALALMMSAGLWAAPAMAQSNESGDSLDSIQRGGAEGSADTTLGKKGLVFTTDGFELRVTTRVQFRLTYQNEVANGSNGTNGRDFINFRIRRAKTKFSGYIFQKEFQYALQLDWTNNGGLIEEAWFRWAVMQYINITAGQTKLPWNWEESSSSGSTQHVDRSYVNEVFNQDYAKGITIDGQVGEDTPWLKYWVGIYNGVLRSNTDYRNADKALNSDSFSNLVDGEMMINLRLETHPLGEVALGMNDMRGEDEYSKVIFAIGIGVNWFLSGYDANTAYGGASNARVDNSGLGATASGRFRTSQDTLSATIDGHFRWHGLSVDAAFFWRHTEFHNRGRNTFDPTSGAGIGNITDSGFTFEVAYMILVNQLSVGVRFDMLNADDFWSSTGNARVFGNRPDTTELGLSVNYYIQGDNLKLTLDIIMVSQQLPVAAANSGLDGVYNAPPTRAAFGGGIGGVNDADHNDLWIIRLQLQWIF